MDRKESFSTSEVARYCHVTADTIRKWAEAGRIRVFKTPGGHRRIRRDDLVQFLRENNIPLHSDLRNAAVRILVVDDEKAIVAVVRRYLERLAGPIEIEVAMDGFDAGQKVATFSPDVVFLDLRLPGMDGFEVCRRIKQKADTASIHVIAMTGYFDAETSQRIEGLGAATCLSKPFTPDDLRKALALVGVNVA